MHAQIVEEAFDQPLRLVVEGSAVNLVADIDIREKEEGHRASLVVGKIPFDLGSVIHTLVVFITWGQGPDTPSGHKFPVENLEDSLDLHRIHR